MAESPVTHYMEPFQFNPASENCVDYVATQSTKDNMSGDVIPIFLSDEMLTTKTSKTTVEPVGPIRTFANQSLFAQGYASEEEASSPVDDNDFGFHSTSDTDSTASIRMSESLEDLCDQTNALQLCSKAQAVQVLSAGKAKVVSVPKVVELSGYNTPNQSPRSSSDKESSSSSFREQPAQPNVVRRKSMVPQLQPLTTSVAPRSNKTQTPLAQQRAEFLKYDPFPSSSPIGTPSSASPTKRKMPKLSPAFKLKAFGRSRRSDSSASSSTDGSEARMDWWSVTSSPVSPDSRDAQRTTNKQPLPKMVARGASERAPPIVLPPCPYDYTDDWDVGYEPQWPLRNDSIPNTSSFQGANAMKDLRRKSVAVAFATSQA